MSYKVTTVQAWPGPALESRRTLAKVPAGIRSGILIFGMLFAGMGMAAAQATDDYYYMYHERPIPLLIEESSIVVLDSEHRPLHAVENYLHAVGMQEFRASGYIKDAIVFERSPAEVLRPTAEIVAEIANRSDNPFFISPSFHGGDGIRFLPRTIAVAFRETVPRSDAVFLIETVGDAEVVVENYGGVSNVYLIAPRTRSGFTVLESTNRLALLPETVWADPLLISTAATPSGGPVDPNPPNDILYNYSWHLDFPPDFVPGNSDNAVDVNAPEAWNLTGGSSTVKLMILDDGIDKSHEDLNVAVGLDCTIGTSKEVPSPCRCDQADPSVCDPAKTFFDPNAGSHVDDSGWHGTPVAGVATATINNGAGSAGIAPGVSLVAARTFTPGAWDPKDIVSALGWAIDNGVDVVSISWNDRFLLTSGEQWMYDHARERGILIIASAGNDDVNRAYWPALHGAVMAVSGVSSDGLRWSSVPGSFASNFGPQIFVAAPSQDIWSTDRSGPGLPNPPISTANCQASGDYCKFTGTSFAAPIVAGIAALIMSINPNLTPEQVETMICATAHGGGGPGVDWIYGCGVVDAKGAVDAALESLDPDRIFVDGFETGSFTAWSTVVGNQ